MITQALIDKIITFENEADEELFHEIFESAGELAWTLFKDFNYSFLHFYIFLQEAYTNTMFKRLINFFEKDKAIIDACKRLTDEA